MGILLISYAEKNGNFGRWLKNGALLDTDTLFPDLALNHVGVFCWGISFCGYRQQRLFFKCVDSS